jgi:hypothetical protein
MSTSKFYIYLGKRKGNIPCNKKIFVAKIAKYFTNHKFAKEILNIDIRSTIGERYHAFLMILFHSQANAVEFVSSIDDTKTKFKEINDNWKIYNYLPRQDRKVKSNLLNIAFCKEEDNQVLDEEEKNQVLEEVNEVLEEDNQVLEEVNQVLEEDNEVLEEDNQVLEEDNQVLEEIQVVEDLEEDADLESIYTWLITSQNEHKKEEEIANLCRWLITPYWER